MIASLVKSTLAVQNKVLTVVYSLLFKNSTFMHFKECTIILIYICLQIVTNITCNYKKLQIGMWDRGLGEIREGNKEVQISIYKINKSWG